MSRMKEKNLRRFVALYIAGSVALGGVAYAAEQENTRFLDGAAATIDESVYSVAGGSFNASVDASNFTIKSDGDIGTLQGGGIAKNGAQANVGQVTIDINGGEVEDLSGGGKVENGGTANVTGKSTIKITDGTVENITGGGYTESGTASVKESIITINGDSEIGSFQGGGDAKGDNATANVKKSTITINGGTLGGFIGDNDYSDESFGGGFATAAVTEGKTNASNVGDVTIKIKDSTFKNNLHGGGMARLEDEDAAAPGLGTASSHVNNVNIAIDGNTKTEGDVTIYAGGAALGDRTKSSVDSAEITISGNAKLLQINGGGDADSGGEVSVGTSNIFIKDDAEVAIVVGGGGAFGGISKVDVSNIQMDGGTVGGTATIDGTVLVGGISGGGSAFGTGTEEVGQSTITINAGTVLGNLYAGGSTEDNGISIVKESTININGGMITGDVDAGGFFDTTRAKGTVNNSTINISGGEIGGNVLRGNATEAALNFTAGTGSTIDGAVSGFDTVTVKTGAKTTFSGANVEDGTAAIQAKALNIEENSTVTVAKNMTFKLGSASAPIPAAFSLRSARVANGMLNLSGELKIVTGAELTLENTTLTSQNTGMVTVGAKKDGSTLTVGKLNMAANSVFADNRVNLNIGLPIDEIKNLSAAEINDVIEQALAPTIANGLDINSLDILNGTNAEYQYIKDENGKITDIKLNNNYLSFYTGVRQANAYIAKNMIGNIHDRNTALRSGEKANDFWVNIRGGKTDVDNGFGKAEVKNQYYQLGYDWDVSSGEDKAVVGVYFSKIYGDITQNSIKSDIDNAYDFGIYGMKEFSNGTYLGLVSRYGQTKNTAKIDDRKVDWKDKGYALSAEFGKRMAQQNGWSLEPYMQLTYNHLSDADLNTGNTDVTLEGSNLLDGKIGVRFIKQEQENQNNNIYAGISYARGLSGDFKMNSRSGMNMTEMDNDTNSFEVALGMNRQISKCSTVNLNAKKEFGDYDGWSVQGMVNVSF